MSKLVNIAIVGLGQVGIYLYNELKNKTKEIEDKTGKKIKIVAISAKNKNKKRSFKIDKKIFYSNPLLIFKSQKIDILFVAKPSFIVLIIGIPPATEASNSKLTLFFSAKIAK